jgi:hypothetical protein
MKDACSPQNVQFLLMCGMSQQHLKLLPTLDMHFNSDFLLKEFVTLVKEVCHGMRLHLEYF